MPDKPNLFTRNEQVKFLQKIRYSRVGVSENSSVLEYFVIWKWNKQNVFNFIAQQAKKSVLGVLNAEGEVTVIFLTVRNSIPFIPA